MVGIPDTKDPEFAKSKRLEVNRKLADHAQENSGWINFVTCPVTSAGEKFCLPLKYNIFSQGATYR